MFDDQVQSDDDLLDESDDEGYQDATLSVQSGFYHTLGTFEVTRSVIPALPVGTQVEIAYGDGRNLFIAVLPEREVVHSVNYSSGRWQPANDGIDFGDLDLYEVTLWPNDPATMDTQDAIAALDDLRAPVMAEMRHELGLPAHGDDRFACLNCGRAASVVVTRERLNHLLLRECRLDYDTWPKLIAELDAGTPRIVPGWMEINLREGWEPIDFAYATKSLEAMVKRGIMRREGNGYVLAPPRCSHCMPVPLGREDELFDDDGE